MQALASARRRYSLSALLARRAVVEAQAAAPRGSAAVVTTVATYQVANAVLSELAVTEMLLEQEIEADAQALLNTLSFSTDLDVMLGMIDSAGDDGFDRLVASLVQDAGRAAESVAVAVRPSVAHVRYLSPPSCPRCALLAGRVYRWSTGFERHPNCDCVMVPTTVAAPLARAVETGAAGDPVDLLDRGLLTGLSQADQKALRDGADLGQIVNIRSRAAGMTESGRVLARAGRPTPEGIYRAAAGDQEAAIAALAKHGYIT